MADILAAHYFAGVIGLSVLRRWYVDGDRNEVRLAELRDLLDRCDEFPHSLKLNPIERDLSNGYAEWSSTYDGPNPLIETENPVVFPLLERLAGAGVTALDAACGTGRHAATLASLGCDTTGVDASAEMLAVAREKVPGARFEHGDVESLPFVDAVFDVAIISLALCHLADPSRAVAELGRVLRPGGALVITDPHPVGELLGGQAFYGGISPGKPMTWVRNHYHSAATWLRAVRAAGLEVTGCEEVPFGESQIAAAPASLVYAEATRDAMIGLPSLWVWHLTKPSR